MNQKNYFIGQTIRLTPTDFEKDVIAMEDWQKDSEYLRLLDSDVAFPRTAKQIKDWYEKTYPDRFEFSIRPLDSENIIGFIELGGVDWVSGNAWVGIGLGGKENWGKGFGTQAMALLVRYAFEELNLHRLTLEVFDHNQRAIRAYEKAGYKIEGRHREMLHRDGKWFDVIIMGILKKDWQQRENSLKTNNLTQKSL